MSRKNKATIAFPREAAMALHWLDSMTGVELLAGNPAAKSEDGWVHTVYVTGFDSQNRQTWAWINADVRNKWKGGNP